MSKLSSECHTHLHPWSFVLGRVATRHAVLAFTQAPATTEELAEWREAVEACPDDAAVHNLRELLDEVQPPCESAVERATGSIWISR